MRTTLSIDDELLARARERARREGLSIGQVVENALRRDLARESTTTPPAIPVFRGGTGPRPGVDLNSNRALAELLDETLPIDRRR